MADIDDPVQAPPDATVMRPAARRRPAPQAPTRRRSAVRRRPRAVRRRARRRSAALDVSRASASIRWCRPPARCCCSAGQLRGATSSIRTSPALRRQALDEIRRFEERARPPASRNEVGASPRATRCAPALDEAVLSTPWGARASGRSRTLLVALHREAWGGEKFFEHARSDLDRSRAAHRPDGAAVPLPGLRLRGKYQVQERGPRAARRRPARALSQDSRPPRHAARRSCRCAGTGSRTAATRSSATCRGGWSARPRSRCWRVTFTIYYTRLGDARRAGARRAGADRPRRFRDDRGRRPSRGPTLKQLLAPEERGGVLQRRGGRRPHAGDAARGATCSRRAAPRSNPAY